MSNFKLGKMTLRSLFKKPETVMYPLEQPKTFEVTRGYVEIKAKMCILCSICQRVCPTDSIVVDKKGGSWTIDWFKCVTCGECVRSCPHDALLMETSRMEAACEKYLHPVEVQLESPAEKAEKERKKKERIAAALAAKAAREAAKEGGEAARPNERSQEGAADAEPVPASAKEPKKDASTAAEGQDQDQG